MAGLPPILWDQAEGFLVRDRFGNQWIDLTSGIVLANAGHAHPRIVAAIREAAEGMLLATYSFPSEARTRLLEKLVSLSPIPDSKALLFSSGTEATECAVMLMRRHGRRIDPQKTGILSLAGGYHGRTLAAHLASGKATGADWIERGRVRHFQIAPPPDPGPADDQQVPPPSGADHFRAQLEALASAGIDHRDIAGLILEPVPGWTTVPLPAGFVGAALDWARRHKVLVTFDEIQCGCGRTGRFFGFQHLGVFPDLITLGKGLSSSLPVSAVVGRSDLLDQPGPGDMSSTHGGNPVCAAAALANLEVLEEEELVSQSAATGSLLLSRLRSLAADLPDQVRSVQGVGLFISVHLWRRDSDEPDIELADQVALESVRRGVMMFTTGRGYLKITPPLCIDLEAAFEAADVVRDCLVEGARIRRVVD
jgi:4-aminobutyrate aminotransferase/diaminobutyrate-pyruvate transaminase/4-aminobutyrate aminotransferase/(S)-3-amino-2-methylpropionate transaminase